MNFQQMQSGLVVPKDKPQPPLRQYGVLEIKDSDRRQMANDGLCLLWDAMNLSASGRMDFNNECYNKLYRYVGECLLGKDCPEKEVLT